MARREYRCHHCNALLVIGDFRGWVEAHCRRCKRKVMFREDDALPEGR